MSGLFLELSSTAFSYPNTIFFFIAIDCGDPGTPTNGQRTLSSTTYNSVVTYTCDVGYTLQGSNSRTCQTNGQWSGSVPRCNRELRVLLLWEMLCLIWSEHVHPICSHLHQSLSKWRDLHCSWHLHLRCRVDWNAVWNRWVQLLDFMLKQCRSVC